MSTGRTYVRDEEHPSTGIATLIADTLVLPEHPTEYAECGMARDGPPGSPRRARPSSCIHLSHGSRKRSLLPETRHARARRGHGDRPCPAGGEDGQSGRGV